MSSIQDVKKLRKFLTLHKVSNKGFGRVQFGQFWSLPPLGRVAHIVAPAIQRHSPVSSNLKGPFGVSDPDW